MPRAWPRWRARSSRRPLPHDIAVLEKTLVDEARAKFGADAIPQNARLATLVHGPTMKAFNQAAEAAGDRCVGPDDLRDLFRDALDTFGAATLAGRRLEQAAAALGVGDVSYNVTETYYGNAARLNPPLLLLMQKGEEFLFGETGIEPGAGSEAFKNWLSDCATGVAKRIETMFLPANVLKSFELYRDAILAADGDFDLQFRVQELACPHRPPDGRRPRRQGQCDARLPRPRHPRLPRRSVAEKVGRRRKPCARSDGMAR